MTGWIAGIVIGVASLSWGIYSGVSTSQKAEEQTKKAEKTADNQNKQATEAAKKQLLSVSREVGKNFLAMKYAKRSQAGVAKNCVDTGAVTSMAVNDTRKSRNGLV